MNVSLDAAINNTHTTSSQRLGNRPTGPMTEPSGSHPSSPGKPLSAMSAAEGDDVPNSNDIDSVLSESADDNGCDAFSGVFSADSISMSEDVRDYVYENSRRYHKYNEGLYHFPNDDAEQEREDLQHAMTMLLCDGKLHFAPLQNPQAVLDIGTGTGIWAIDMGDEYPGSEVLGIDLSPIQPLWVPRNVQFLVDNLEEDWLQPANSLDFIHGRQMAPSIRNWPKMIAEAYNALKPGGWIEFQELECVVKCDDGTMSEDDACAGYAKTLMAALHRLGIDSLGFIANCRQWLRDAGFINVRDTVLKTPIGTWPKDPHQQKIGLYSRNMIYDGLHGFSIKPFTHGLGWTPEEVEVYLVDVRKALLNTTAHIYLPFHVVYAQKPLTPQTRSAE
ncbi:S-adenosyl-L-methionine-dependent methyltransferase [Hypoxylon trugodes]|uniref:S-adenosyl-L-methionine-dependent methyltransferase n=1 Tax=Hypoxylon trugodes TaxID=326681 RepID=UPI00219F9795|nr:S-adenosyl-L-methionine-dependent methyltransferase [Hypoxylon trugodes]KAI1389041.1 S-adenosyl-L-methionine-dependent methyltransferase [Hypoxylon trugodes]